MDRTLRIIVDGQNRGGKKVLGELQKDVSGLTKSFNSLKSAGAELAVIAGPLLAVGAAAKKTFDFAMEGGELELAEYKFARLARTVGTTGDLLLMDLKGVARGMMTDADLMKNAGDLMALGLAKTRDEAVRLTRVSAALGMNMNQLTLTLTNQTTMRFDALGVSVDGFDERLERLKATGMDTNEAFKQAFLAQAEEQIEKVGEVADTSAGKLIALQTEWINFMNEMKIATLGLFESTEGLTGVVRAYAMLRKAVNEGKMSQAEANFVTFEMAASSYDAADAIKLVQSRLNPAIAEAGRYQAAFAQSTKVTREATDLNRDFADSAYESYSALSGLNEATVVYSTVTGGAHKAASLLYDDLNRNLPSAIDNFMKDLEWEAAGGGKLQQMFEDVKAQIQTGKVTPEEGRELLEGLFIAAETLQVELGDESKWDAAKRIVESLGVSWAEALQLIKDFKGEAKFDITSRVRIQMEYDAGMDAGFIPEGMGVSGSPKPKPGGFWGTSFTVPPGYPGDTYMVPATSGEQVTVSSPHGGPAEQQSGGNLVINQHFYNQGSAALGMALVNEEKRKRLNATMGWR